MTKDTTFDESNAVQSNWMKWNVPGEDKIRGTLLEKRQMKSTLPGQEGKMVNVYEMKADEGVYHTQDDKKKVVAEPIIINPGDFFSIGGTAVIDRQMQNVKKGQKIGMKFIEEKPSKTKGFAPAKIIKVYTPKAEDGSFLVDEEYLNELRVSEF